MSSYEEDDFDAIVEDIIKRVLKKIEKNSGKRINFYPYNDEVKYIIAKNRLEKRSKKDTLLIEQADSDDHIDVFAFIPGIKKEDVFVSCFDNELFLFVVENEKPKSHCIKLACSVNPATAEGEIRNGVLKLRIAKCSQGDAKEIGRIIDFKGETKQ